MALRVVRYQHQDATVDIGDGETLLFDPRFERGVGRWIGDRYRRLDVGARNTEHIVIRSSEPDVLAEVEADKMMQRLAGRTPVAVLSPDVGGAPALQPVSWSTEATDLPLIEAFREAELLCGLGEQRAVFRHPGCHYLLPSAIYHADAFVRLEDALQDYTDLLRLTDWLAYRVDERTALAADNGSLLALLATVALRVRDRLERTPPIATLNEYPIGPTAIADTVDRFRAQGWERLLFCVSVNSSGRVAREVSGLEGVDVEVVILCETQAAVPDDGLTRFAQYPIERWEADAHGRCEQCSERHLLAVDPRTYEVRTQIRLRATPPDLPHAEANRGFWEAAERQDAVALHVDASTAEGSSAPARHLAVALDIARLLGDAGFRASCVEELRSISVPAVVAIPRHASTDALASLVHEAFPALPAERIVPCPIGEVAATIGGALGDAEHALIVDDTLVSGGTLVAFHQELYAATRAAGPLKVSAFVALSRPGAIEDLEHVCRRFSQRSTGGDGRTVGGLHYGHGLLLPDGNACPWCAEQHFIERRLDQLGDAERAFAADRRTHLVGGVTAPLLICPGEEDGKTVGSFFGELGSEAAFAAVSALAQHMHRTMDRDRRDETLRVLDVPLVLQAFFDPIIVAGMLRTFPARDLRDPGNEPAVARVIRENAKNYPDATIAELALAVTAGKLPVRPVRELLNEREDPPWAATLLSLLEGY